MKKILFILFFCFCSVAHAETYAVDRADGGVSLINYNEGAQQDTLEDVINALGFQGRPIRKVSSDDLPQTREDRKFWTLQGNKVVIDEAKKQDAEDAEAVKESEKAAVLEKLKISQEEFEKLNDKESSQGIAVIGG